MTYKNEPADKRRRLISRRDLLFQAGGGIGGLALTSLLNQHGLLAAESTAENGAKSCASSTGITSPFAPKPPHFKPRAKRVIYLFQSGAPSQMDLFDHKPHLKDLRGAELPDSIRQGHPRHGREQPGCVLGARSHDTLGPYLTRQPRPRP